MRRSFKLLTIASLATPIVALPMINATFAINNQINNNDEQETYSWGEADNQFTVRFTTDPNHPDWGTFGEIYAINIADDENYFGVPATIEHNGQQYKIRKINTANRIQGNHYLMNLDLSKAIWLDEICDQAFDRGQKSCLIDVGWVNFEGAVNLTRIGKWAFSHQALNLDGTHTRGLLNFASTKITTIDKGAFYGAASSYDKQYKVANCFHGVVFPSTLTYLGPDSFGGHSAKRTINCEKMVFLSPDPSASLLGNTLSIPTPNYINSHNVDWIQILVPNGCQDKYSDLDNFPPSYKKYVYGSRLIYKDLETKPTGLKTQAGHSGSIEPYDDEKKIFAKDATLELTNDFGGKLKIDDDNRISWDKGLPAGEYQTQIIAKQYDTQDQKKMSFVISPTIDILIVNDYGMVDASTELYIKKGSAGEDKKLWKPYINGAEIESTTFSISGDTSGKIRCENEGLNGRIKWEAFDNDFDETFTISVNMITKTGHRFAAERLVHLTVSDLDLNFGIILELDGVKYTGEDIILDPSEEQTKKMSINIVGEQIGSITEIKQPHLSAKLGNADVYQDGSATKFGLNLKSQDEEMLNGDYRFYIIGQIKVTGYDKYIPLYSDLITVKKGTVPQDVNVLPTEVLIQKNTEGTHTLNVLNLKSSQIITNVELKENFSEPEFGDIHANVSENGRDIILDWNELFATTEAHYKLRDIYLKIDMKDEMTNEDTFLSTSLTMIPLDNGSISYKGDNHLYVYGEHAKTFEEPFTYLVNGEEPLDCSGITFDVSVNNDPLEKYKGKIGINYKPDINRAYLSCNLEEDDRTLKGLEVVVKAYDTISLTSNTYAVLLYAGNILKLSNVPTEWKLKVGEPSESDPFAVTFNEETATDLGYSIEGIESGAISVKDNCLVWSGNAKAGTYQVKLIVTKKYNERTYTDSAVINVTVEEEPEPTPAPKNNTGLIVGCSVGGAVVVAGGTTGTVLGVKKHKAKIKK